MFIGVPDKILIPWLKDKDYIVATDEGEAVGIAAGYYLATKIPATVFMSADGFGNALNPLTSFVIPEDIKMNFVISIGRQEPSHKVMTDTLWPIILKLPYDPERISFQLIRKE